MEAHRLFSDTGITIRSDGCRYLGGALGEQEFCRSYMSSMVEKWCKALRILAEIAQTQPHAAYAVFTKGLCSKWKYYIRSTECPPEVFRTLDDLLNTALLSALTGRTFHSSEPERVLLSLPARLGGLAIPIMGNITLDEHLASQRVTRPVVDLIASSSGRAMPNVNENLDDCSQMEHVASVGAATNNGLECDMQCEGQYRHIPSDAFHVDPVLQAVAASRKQIRNERSLRQTAIAEVAQSLLDAVSNSQRLLLSSASEKGVSSWLTVDPSPQFGTVLNKSDFRDAVCLRYGFALDGLPTTCVCGAEMTTDHALICPCGGYPTARHNEVRDVVADAMCGVFQDVEIEPQLLAYEEEDLSGKTANRSAAARVDIRARGFWTRQQDAFFDVRVTHPKANLLSRTMVNDQLQAHEREKKRQYCERINQVDRGVFTPLVFSTTGITGRECARCLKMLVTTIVEKNIDLQYSRVMNHLRCKLAFCLLRWSITCLRGCRASYRRHRGPDFISECRLASS